MFGSRLPKSRRFNYEPRFYNPDKDEREKRRIDFKRKYRKQQARQRSLIWLIALLILLLYVIFILSRIGR